MLPQANDREAPRFGAGLTEADVRRFQAILREQCGVDLPVSEAWSRAIELPQLVEMLLEWRGVFDQPREESTEFALSSLLTDSRS